MQFCFFGLFITIRYVLRIEEVENGRCELGESRQFQRQPNWLSRPLRGRRLTRGGRFRRSAREVSDLRRGCL